MLCKFAGRSILGKKMGTTAEYLRLKVLLCTASYRAPLQTPKQIIQVISLGRQMYPTIICTFFSIHFFIPSNYGSQQHPVATAKLFITSQWRSATK
jgi:hypothetical protein